MPTYKYQCNEETCGYTFDDLQQMSDPAHTRCPKCERYTLQRLIGAGGGILFPDGAPGQTVRRSVEDQTAFDKAAVARRMKAQGKVPMEERIDFKDIDLAKVNNVRLPPIRIPKTKSKKKN